MRSGWMGIALTVVATAHPLPATAAARSPAAVVDAALADWARQSGAFNGVVLVRRGHGAPIVRASGIADAAHGRRTTAATLYQMGSFSKWVASLVVLRLVDQGKLSLTTPIGAYLPGYRRDIGGVVTLHHLLSHTSGVRNDLATALGKDRVVGHYAALSTADAVERFASGDPVFSPGARFDYSHANWLLVGAIVERVTGGTYRQAVDRLVTRPLGLRENGLLPPDFMSLPAAANGYTTLLPEPVAVPSEQMTPFPEIIAPVGGYYSAATDIVRLLDAVYDGRFLTPASRAALWQVNAASDHYAYGGRVFSVDLGSGPRRMARNNNSNGAYKTFELRVDDGTTILLLNNSRMDQQALNVLGDRLLTALYPQRRASE